MTRASKVKQFVYGLGAFGGGVAIISTVIEKYYKGEPIRTQKLLFNLGSQLKAESQFGTNDVADTDSYDIESWSWPKWDWDWDKRDHLRKKRSDENNNDDSQSKKITATRHLILIRHGQYNLDGQSDEERYLTDLGKSQATMTGMRLADLGLPYNFILHSNMSRAIETANLISKHLPQIPMLPSDAILREGGPCDPEPRVGRYPDTIRFTEGARIEAAFRKYFHRAESSQKEDSYEIIVCHANVIRYFVCRALQFPPEAWLRMSLKHASLTWLTIRPDGRVSIRGLGEAGHLKPEMLTTS